MQFVGADLAKGIRDSPLTLITGMQVSESPPWSWSGPSAPSTITGHRGLPAATERLVDQAIRDQLASDATRDHLVGLSNLADGADQIFARAVLDVGGQLEVIIPAAQYRDGLPESAHAGYDSLLAAASRVDRLDYVESTEEAHMAASQAMLDRADRLYAVWDGKPARGFGGTADVVTEARKLGVPVTVIWPKGASRDEAA